MAILTQNTLIALLLAAWVFFQGTEIFFAALNGLGNRAVDLLAENGENFCLPTDALVFAMHQGYEFNYFLLSQGDNPAVYQYVEGRGNPVLTWKTLSEFLSDAIAAHAQSKC